MDYPVKVDENGVEYIELEGFKLRVHSTGSKDRYSVESWTRLGYSEEEAVQKVLESAKIQSPDYIEYYLRRGMDLEQAQQAVQDRKDKKERAQRQKESDPKTRDYWLARGYSFEQATHEMSRVRGENSSILRIEYWVSNGYSVEDASKKVSDIQKRNSPKSTEYWVSRGLSEQEAVQKVSEYQSNISRSNESLHDREYQRRKSKRCIEYYLARGYSEDDAKEMVRKFNDNVSVEAFKKRYGDSWEVEREKFLNKSRVRNSGKGNGMYGKSAPKGSGRGYSGYYKGYYFRSLFEYFYMKQCERDNIPFVCNDVSKKVFKDKIVIPLSESRNYIPDFIEGTSTIIEIKNRYVYETSFKQEKLPYLERYCQEHNMSYKVLLEDDLDLDYNSLIHDFNIGLVVIDSGKLERFKKHILGIAS